MIKTLNELIRELQEIRNQTDDYDMGSLPVDIVCEYDELYDIYSVICENNNEGHPRVVRIYTS